jgi:hypothetical protein
MDGDLCPADSSIKDERTSIVVGCDEPQPPTSRFACNWLNSAEESVADACSTDSSNENNDLTLVSLDSIEKQAHRHTLTLSHKAEQRWLIVKDATRH